MNQTSHDLRDQLAYRQLRGDHLTLREELVLTTLTRITNHLLPPPAPLPERVTNLVDELLLTDEELANEQ